MSEKIPLEEWAPAEVAELDLYKKREKIYTRKIEGFFQRIRQYTGWPLLLGYFLLPWFQWGERQAVLFDLPARKFHILGLTIWPQDMSLLGLVLIIAAYALFLVTTVAGRVWCGYSCPQTVWTSVFMWIEQRTEGTRNQRMKLDAAPWSLTKIRKRGFKHFGWLCVAFGTGFTFVGYFTPVRDLSYSIFSFSMAPAALFWMSFFALATYANAGWMREQVCMYMCPYARFQSAMFDKDTLIVSYDEARGEARGSRKRNDDIAALGLGDCIDCQMCVQVCPTGIDIRDGLQYECITCALCIDACDSIMEKMNYEKGLISYTTAHRLAGGESKILRPKVIGYAVVLCIIIGFFSWRVFSIDGIEVSVIRDRQQVTGMADLEVLENRYMVKIANKSELAQSFTITVKGEADFSIVGVTTPSVSAGEVESIPVRVTVDANAISRPILPLEFHVVDQAGELYIHESRFIGAL